MTQAKLEALLGRPLTTIEAENLDLYLEIAKDRLSELLCTSLSCTAGTRDFETRENYSTVFTDVFTEVFSVKIDDTEVDPDTYTKMQFDNRNGDWFNSIVFKTPAHCNRVVTIDAAWGFDKYPADLGLVLAKLFAVTSTVSNAGIKSKKIEDFTVTFKDDAISPQDQFLLDNSLIINKYSQCSIGEVQSGTICHIRHY